MLDALNKDLVLLDAKVKFILDYIDDKIIVKNRKMDDIENDLFEMGYPKLDKDNKKNDNGNYNYLLNMNLSSLTLEKKEQLIKERDIKNEMIALLESKTATDLWVEDLDIFKKSYIKFVKDTENSFETEKPKKKKKTIKLQNNTKSI